MIETKFVIVMEDGSYYCDGGYRKDVPILKAANVVHATLYPNNTDEADSVCRVLLENGYKCHVETTTVTE